MEPLALKIYMLFLTQSKCKKISGFISFGILGVFSGGMGWQFLYYSRLTETTCLGDGCRSSPYLLRFAVLIHIPEDLNT